MQHNNGQGYCAATAGVHCPLDIISFLEYLLFDVKLASVILAHCLTTKNWRSKNLCGGVCIIDFANA